MNESLQAIEELRSKLELLLSKYESLKKENNDLKDENFELQRLLLEKEQTLINKKREMEYLRFAETIKGSSKDIRHTRLKINALIREVDKCIVQLSS